jgi:membrane-bound ClpP family serine protease
LRVSTTGLLFLLLGSLLFAANIFVMTFKWKLALIKSVIAAIKRRWKLGGEIMKNGFSVFIAAFIALGASWCGFVLAPVLQLGTAKQTAVLNSGDTYPVQRTGDATLGLQVYRANGCAACHTEQIQQTALFLMLC